MHQLIPFEQRLVGDETVHTADGRNIHAFLEIARDYADWIKRQIKRARFIENTDYTVFYTHVENPKGGRPSQEYHFTFDACKHIGMLSATAKGDQVRKYFLACEKQVQAQHGTLPTFHNPQNKMLVETLVRIDTLEAEQAAIKDMVLAQQADLIAHQQKTIEALSTSTRAETKADMALDETRRMTIEEFILINGLLQQFPLTRLGSYVAWLKIWCTQYNQRIDKAPVLGKSWDKELAYPIQALAAWLRYEQRRPQQIILVRPPETGAQHA